MMERVGRYIKEDEIIKERFIEGLKPKHKKNLFSKTNRKKMRRKKSCSSEEKKAPKKKKK